MLIPKTINGFADFISPAANGDMKAEGKTIAQKSKRRARETSQALSQKLRFPQQDQN
jgi:hypothetical protein